MASTTIGYPKAMFFNEIKEGYICVVCNNVLRNPVQRGCGHRMCRQCAETFSHASPKCARCSLIKGDEDVIQITLETRNKIFPDKAALADMKYFKCQCLKCKWTGYFKDYKEHVKRCTQ